MEAYRRYLQISSVSLAACSKSFQIFRLNRSAKAGGTDWSFALDFMILWNVEANFRTLLLNLLSLCSVIDFPSIMFIIAGM